MNEYLIVIVGPDSEGGFTQSWNGRVPAQTEAEAISEAKAEASRACGDCGPEELTVMVCSVVG